MYFPLVAHQLPKSYWVGPAVTHSDHSVWATGAPDRPQLGRSQGSAIPKCNGIALPKGSICTHSAKVGPLIIVIISSCLFTADAHFDYLKVLIYVGATVILIHNTINANVQQSVVSIITNRMLDLILE